MPISFLEQGGPVYWGEEAVRLYQTSQKELESLSRVVAAEAGRNLRGLTVSPLTVIRAFSCPKKFDLNALSAVARTQIRSSEWTAKAKKLIHQALVEAQGSPNPVPTPQNPGASSASCKEREDKSESKKKNTEAPKQGFWEIFRIRKNVFQGKSLR